MKHRTLPEFLARAARERARHLVWEFGITEPHHIQLEDIAFSLGVHVREGNLSGAAARLTIHEGKAIARLPDGALQTGRGRFSLAHELGHFLLHHTLLSKPCAEMDLHSWASNHRFEAQANIFASELLLPEALVQPYISTFSGLETALTVARDFKVSPTASAIRVCELATRHMALIFASREGIEWIITSRLVPRSLLSWGTIDRGTITGKYLYSARAPSGCEAVAGDLWLADRWQHLECELYEECLPIPSLRASLTLLAMELETGAVDELLQELEESGV